ncbi:MAG: hypothetical protein A2710_18270 [Burkholderiales bacterium RIFCSPHIGHO2_01_FULL_64_960]|nr:MAG: hypothetical protein A2710_18270 [Burkholderiales bacterium RIFCSPHIGHO2_01_FULL_64_960]
MSMYPQHLHPDDYQRLRDEAKRHALQLRQDAIREAHTWVARGFLRMVRRAFHLARTEAEPMNPSTPELKTPCQPLS